MFEMIFSCFLSNFFLDNAIKISACLSHEGAAYTKNEAHSLSDYHPAAAFRSSFFDGKKSVCNFSPLYLSNLITYLNLPINTISLTVIEEKKKK